MSTRQTGPLPTWLLPVTHLAAAAYGVAVRARTRRFDAGYAPQSLGVPVVSVGNITAGGTGKTPFVRWCVEALRAQGHHPAVALRGYRARNGASDEAMEYRALLPGTPIAVGSNRAAELERALKLDPTIDCAVLDDAFQHRRLARALDIVLVDATRPGLHGSLLPAGWLREPPTALQRAGLVVVTRAAAVDAELSELIERFHGKPPAGWCRHAWGRLDVFECAPGEAPVHRAEPVDWLRERGVVAAAALGNPAPFVRDLQRAGAIVRAQMLRRDHAAYGSAEAARLADSAQRFDGIIATTWKDWTKLGHTLAISRRSGPLTVVVPRVFIEFAAGESVVRAALGSACRTRGG